MKNIKLLAVSALIGTSFVAGQMFAPSASTLVPGSAQDPVVTETLMKQELGKLNNEITSLKNTITALEKKVNTLSSSGSGSTNSGSTSNGTTTGGSTSSGSTDTTTSIGTGVVVPATLNVRSGAGTSYSKVGTLYKGNKVTLVKKSGSWYQIKYGTISGWVSGDYLTVTTSAGSNSNTSSGTTTTTKTGVVSSSAALNIRSGAGTSYSKVGSAPVGATITILKTSGDWHQIKYGNITGWVSAAYVTVK